MLVGGMLGSSSKLVERFVITRVLEPGAYGEVVLGLSVLALSTTLTALGLNQGIARYMSRFDEERDVRGLWLTGLVLGVSASLLLTAFLLTNGRTVVALVFDSPDSRSLLNLFVLAIPFNVAFYMAIGGIRGFENTIYRTYSQDLFYNGFRFVLLVGLLLAGFGVMAVGYAYLAAAAATVVVAHLFLNRLISLRGAITVRPRQLLTFSLPLVLAAMVSRVLGEVDTLMLGFFTNSAVVGLYDPAYQLASGLPVILSSFGFLYFPLTSRLDSEESHDEINSIYKVTTKWLFIAGFPLYLLFVAFPHDLMFVLFSSDFVGGSDALWLVATGFFISAAVGRAQDTLAALGYTRIILGINTAAVAVDIVLNALLIPRFGLMGAATATAVSFVTLNVSAFGFLWYTYGITPFSRWSVRTYVLLPGVLIPVMIYISQRVTLTAASLPIFVVVSIVSTIAVAALSGCLQTEDEIPLEIIEDKLPIHIPLVRRFIPS
ncbi:flippase [Halococcus hamelinensis]|uniref:Polysaccharide biosynthesis protein n=1 Tax=Halococcus hamelinensis 100A6 TaxID=1132509 RepID=M0M382_9EURY|nr:flippase [Halococcus hamelinensis]EMA38845.1 polysaccharide biosynthesis protein [Halococcus hamelinensis 100A6]